MDNNKSIVDINKVLDDFSDHIRALRDQPAKVDDAFRKAAIAAAEAEGATFFGLAGAVAGAIYGAMNEDDFTGYMQDHKEEIKKGIQELLNKLQTAVDGLKAPVAFLQTSEAWITLKGKIGSAQNNEVNKGNLTGYWTGAAALKYTAARTLQDTAMDSAKSTCDKMAEALAKISDTAWDFYSKIVTDIANLLITLGQALTKIATFVAAPFGISDAIDAVGTALKNVVEYTSKLADSLLSQSQSISKIHESIESQKGFHNNRWPRSDSNDFSITSPGGEWQAT